MTMATNGPEIMYASSLSKVASLLRCEYNSRTCG
jgi:hypothetical protein